VGDGYRCLKSLYVLVDELDLTRRHMLSDPLVPAVGHFEVEWKRAQEGGHGRLRCVCSQD